MNPENTVTALTFKSSVLEVSAIGHFAIGALVVLVVLWFVGRIIVNRLRG
jgi:hypothetical protein